MRLAWATRESERVRVGGGRERMVTYLLKMTNYFFLSHGNPKAYICFSFKWKAFRFFTTSPNGLK